METEAQRSTRRAMSAWLTRQINDVAGANAINAAAIRVVVIDALQEIDTRIAELNRLLQQKYHVAEGRDLVKFYMKGGNAFECIRDRNGNAATQHGGGGSDWDTQIVVDPWAPQPLQHIVYGLVEELVTDTLMRAGVEIALVADDFANAVLQRWGAERHNVDGRNCSAYMLKYDSPQSLRQVFDQERLGLWTNDKRRLSDPSVDHPERIPGILLNDAIAPFILHRLGYTWHVQPDPQARLGEDAQIRKPALMELIDVTLPRRNTIEAVAVWEELEQGHVTVEDCPIEVNVPASDGIVVQLPLPDIMYHVREICTMLCEIADGSSHHADKLVKRFQRFKLIWDNSDDPQRQAIVKSVSALAGVADIGADRLPHAQSVTDAITQYCGAQTATILANTDQPFTLARVLMDRIAHGAAGRAGHFSENGHVSRETLITFDQARAMLLDLIPKAMRQLQPDLPSSAIDAAFSDDMVLLRALEQNQYLVPRDVGLSGVFPAAVIRLATGLQVDALRDVFRRQFDPELAGPRTTSIRFRTYHVPRVTGFSHECTMVVFDRGMAQYVVSMTTALPGEAPFRKDEVHPELPCASLSEIALQRKVAAALIESYLIRTTISRQYEALKTLLPVM